MNNVTLTETWKPVCGYEGFYEVSNCGRIKSLVAWNGHEYYHRKKIMKQSRTTTGYKKVELYKDGKRKSHKVHRLVAIAFIPNPKNKPHINHIDGNTVNNSVDNLEWCTPKENVDHALATGLKKTIELDKKPLEQDYKENRMSMYQLAEKYGCSTATIRKQLKKHGITRPASKFGIIVSELKEMFDKGYSNKEIAEKYGCGCGYVARRKYQYKHGMI